MSILDVDFDNLTPAQSRAFDVVAESIRKEFNAFVGALQATARPGPVQLLHSIFSRNPHCSPLYLRCCRIAYLRTVLAESTGEIRVVAEDWLLMFVLKRSLGCSRIQFRASRSGRGMLRLAFRPLYAYVQSLTLLATRWLGRRSLAKGDLSKDQRITIVDTFLLSGSSGGVANGQYNDRYYPGMFDTLSEEEQKAVYYLATIIDFTNHRRGFDLLRSADRKFIIPDDWLTAGDFYRLAAVPLRFLQMRIGECRFLGINLQALVTSELWYTCADWAPIQGHLNYLFCRRLASAGIRLRLVIDWFENQSIDRGLILGVHHFYPSVTVKGYQGYVISPLYNIHIHPTQSENDAGVIPDVVAVIGDGFCAAVREFMPNLRVEVAPAYRFSGVWRQIVRDCGQGRHNILVGLPISMEESVQLIRALKEIEGELKSEGYSVHLRAHPCNPISAIAARVPGGVPKEFSWSMSDLSSAMAAARIFIGIASSTCLEAVATGMCVIVVGSASGLTQNPVPMEIPRDACTLCYSGQEILQTLAEFQPIIGSKSNHQALVEEVRRNYFSRISPSATREFLNLSNPAAIETL